MTIKIIEEPDVYLTPNEHAKYSAEYREAFMFYSGTPPTFESWVRLKKANTDIVDSVIARVLIG